MSDLLARLREALRDRYVVEREAGRGGMATVFLARDRKLGREVAIKVLSPTVMTAVAGERFLREIRITAQLQHPNILSLIDSGEAAGLLYSVMPFVDGESLRERLLAGPLPVSEALLLGREIVEALDYAHRRGVVHRDVKPENILLSNGHAVVADFGIARAIGLASGNSLTARGLPIGTAAYMSPEQAQGGGGGDPRSDVYSAGCVLYEMLTGRMAFGGVNLREVLARQAAGQPTPIAELRPDVPPPVTAIVTRATAKRAEDRYQTAGEMATDLRLALGEPARQSAPVVTPVAEWREALGPASGMGAAWGRALLAAAVLVLLALGVTRFRTSRSRADAPTDVSVAVLPFATRSPAVEDEYLGDGLSREVLEQLSQVRQLEVAPPASVGALTRRRLTVRQIADTLHVRHVLDGSLDRRGDEIDVRLRLIDARRGRVLWQQTYRLREPDLLRVHEVVARQVAQVLLARSPGVTMPSEPRHTSRPAAHDAYLKGVYWLERRTPEGLRLAAAAFGDALAQDPSYPQALAGLAAARTYRVIYGYRSEADPYSELAEALRLADRAIALDPTGVEGYLARADARSIALTDEDSIRADVAVAGRLRPHSADVAMATAWSLFRSGAGDSALAEARRALTQDPLAPGLRHALIALAIGTRRYDVALREVRRVHADSGDAVLAFLRGYAELLSGDAVGCAARDPGPWVAVRAMCLQRVGRAAEGEALADSLARELDGEHYAFVHQYADLAAYYAWRGDAAGAARWLDRSLAHSPMLHRWQLESGLFDRVRTRPEFHAALAHATTDVRARLAARRAALGN